VDVCRFLLPAASLANVGVTINARALEYAICKMLSSPLVEIQQIGDQLRRVARSETPTLIKYAACNRYMLSIRENASGAASILEKPKTIADFRRVSYNPKGEDEVLAAILFRFGGKADYESALAYIAELDKAEKESLAAELMNSRGRFDQPVREFEFAQMTFEVVMDQGAYFEFKRHRMMTQTVQQLSADLGFAVPRAIAESGCETDYLAAMRKAGELYQDLADLSSDAASYIIPNGFNRRVLFTMNLREAFNFVRLRAAENAHFSIRRIAQQLVEAIREIYPLLGTYLDAPDEDWRDIERKHFTTLKVH
jgi:thymidylate synthase ThyX